MAEPVFYVRGIPTGPIFRDPEVIRDFLLIAEISNDNLDRIIVELSNTGGFLDQTRTRKLVRKFLEPEDAQAVCRVVQNIKPSSLAAVLSGLAEWRKEPDNSDKISVELFQRLSTALRKLIVAFPAIERFRKAERLSRATGHSLEELEIICDIRPIFDDKRETVEGMFPVTTLRVIAQNVDGLPIMLEAQVTLTQLKDLVEKAQKAESKANAIINSIGTWLPDGLPKLRSLRTPKAKAQPEEADSDE